eukprot:gene15153-biopygen16979
MFSPSREPMLSRRDKNSDRNRLWSVEILSSIPAIPDCSLVISSSIFARVSAVLSEGGLGWAGWPEAWGDKRTPL